MVERAKSLSIKTIKAYKFILMGLVSGFVLFYVATMLQTRGVFGVLSAALYLIILGLYWYPNLRKFLKTMREVSYDSKNLFVKEGGYEIQIPFHEIKSVDILSLDGLYRFKLYTENQFGKEVVCKPSIWYPLNYKKVDAELNRVRGLVRKAHFEYQEQDHFDNQLPSN